MSMTTSPSTIEPGDEVTVTLRVDPNGFGQVVGVFLDADAGTLATVSGQGLATVPAGLTHSQPRALVGGMADLVFRWTAPASPGAVRFEVSVLAGNDNGGSSGDRGDEGRFDFVYGCRPQMFFLDIDGDGYGRDDAMRLSCAGDFVADHVAISGDCDDTRETVHPDAVELCNQRDDDCDAEIDEDAIPIALFPDADGDGYFGQVEGTSTDTVMGCVGTPGYAGEAGDCAPDDPSKHPGAEEVCNLYDDNCDGRADERVRPICGVGWCAREAWTCDPINCDPGEPQPELCNLLDDDCDDQLDEDAQCPEGQACVVGECTPVGAADDGGDAGSEGASTGVVGEGSTDTGGPAASSGDGSRCSVAANASAWWLVPLVLVRRARRRT